MRELTPIQQEVMDLIEQGWELGSSLDLSGRCWIQKGGLGKGGESKTVSSSTIRTLVYLGYIEQGERHFPTLHYRLKTKKPTTEARLVESDPVHGDNYTHPSFGTISFNRAQGSSSALFGSSIKHNHVIILRISHAERHLSNLNEYIFSKGVIVEAYMSPTQFADAMTGAGSGGEAPITIQFTEQDGKIEQPSFVNRRQEFEAEFFKRADEIITRMDTTIEQAKDRKVPRWLVHEMDITRGWLKSNIPYLAEQFADQMEKTVTEAKAEVEAYISGAIRQTGLQALDDMRPQLTEGDSENDELPEGETNGKV